jgi:acyl dehydratase
LTVIRYETRSLGAGDVIATTWSTSIFREVALPAEPFVLAEPPAAISPGLGGPSRQRDWPVPIHLTHAYSECAAIWNPIHTEEPVARAAGLPRIIVHGTILWALAGLALAELNLGGDVGRLARLTGRFTAPIVPGGAVTVITQGDGKAIGWRLLDSESGRVCVSGQAEVR